MLFYSNSISEWVLTEQHKTKWSSLWVPSRGFARRPPGYFSQSDGLVYKRLASEIIHGNIAEVGVAWGLSIWHIFDICSANRTQIYAIDAHIQDLFLWYLTQWNNQSTVIPISGYSIESASRFSDLFFDLVFIDANHTYEYVKADVEAWLPKIKKGGTIAGHDYGLEGGVKQAVDELFPDAIKPPMKWSSIWIAKVA